MELYGLVSIRIRHFSHQTFFYAIVFLISFLPRYRYLGVEQLLEWNTVFRLQFRVRAGYGGQAHTQTPS